MSLCAVRRGDVVKMNSQVKTTTDTVHCIVAKGTSMVPNILPSTSSSKGAHIR